MLSKFCFTCTFMELKFGYSTINERRTRSFTCTFMELKFLIIVTSCPELSVLLVPLWNWNCLPIAVAHPRGCFTCTFMELKCFTLQWSSLSRSFYLYLYGIEIGYTEMSAIRLGVLLVPLWNWNKDSQLIKRFMTMVLLVPLWNWNY